MVVLAVFGSSVPVFADPVGIPTMLAGNVDAQKEDNTILLLGVAVGSGFGESLSALSRMYYRLC